MVMVYQAAAIWRTVLQLIPDPCLANRLVSGTDPVGLYDLESPSCWGLCQARQQLAFKLLPASRHSQGGWLGQARASGANTSL